jgi:hypothetical protein
MGDLQIIYGFCVFFVAATLLLMAYAEGGFEDVEVYYEDENESEQRKTGL